ncbi:MAG TPA: response regulator [Candidatus Nealsonbacteria bacterium]|uniref:Response regulatory domain-containing protein n=1 Tax=marine sediment metagenome TaxID=412755 RepID=A0A0F9VBY3_9ZZZZ|nr:response regulator [Candidatus Nealsonbacteria bacterium]HEB46679.1 response regulator [Candidatus Nealsonbacteria bacterium]
MIKKIKKRILLIDDDSFIRKMYKERLLADGFIVDEAENGRDGLEKVNSGDYDFVLLDVVMPDMTGVEVLKKIRANNKLDTLQVIILSALGQELDIKEALNAGAKEYIVKDKTTPRELVERLRNLINT